MIKENTVCGSFSNKNNLIKAFNDLKNYNFLMSDIEITTIDNDTNSISIHFDSFKWEEKAKEILKEYEASNIFSSLDISEDIPANQLSYSFDENSFQL